MTYHRVAVPLAPARTHAGSLVGDLQFVARRLYFSAVVGEEDKQFLQDFARDEQRYQLKALQRLVYCASRSTKPEDREALAEYIRAHCLNGASGATVPDVHVALDLETMAQGPADIAARAFEQHPSRATRDAAIERHTAHYHGLRAVLDSLHISRC